MVAVRSQISPFFHTFSQKKNPQKHLTIFAKKKEDNILPQNSIFKKLKLSKSLLARSAIAVFGLGFIDAGYSGDWSRIGVISKEIEEQLKVATFLVVPFCLLLIFYISSREEKG
ncbi:hypothetical protein M5689_011738 [Euphorbia peplus]|nr:hypothetical protein M5689_011738 [Euphorbia peplus]